MLQKPRYQTTCLYIVNQRPTWGVLKWVETHPVKIILWVDYYQFIFNRGIKAAVDAEKVIKGVF